MNCDPKIKNRMQRCAGQMNGVMKMMEDEKDCKDIVTQLSAVRSSIDKVIALIVVNNVKDLCTNDMASEEAIDAAVELLLKSR